MCIRDRYNEIADYHKDWADEIKKRTDIKADTVHNIVQEEVGHVFVRVLEDAGVYKRDEKEMCIRDRYWSC